MKKKKLSIIVASIAIIACVGGTFAWFTATDSVTNNFVALGNDDEDKDKDDGVEVEEVFDKETAGKTTPGTEVNKDVAAKNTATYDSFIRIKFDKVFNETPYGGNDINKINLTYQNLTTTLENGKWVDGGDGYFYYLGKVAPQASTTYVLDSVALDKSADNTYKNCTFDVIVTAEGIQASNGAAADTWTTAPKAVLDKLTSLQ
ncbi:MAG: hypothetical protein GX275_04655 [Clostridiales bacterium]|nr:hypothetical protein [Clostridiales bacterium]